MPSPIISARPLAKNAVAIVMPAANISRMPQGISVAVSQSSKPPPFSERTINISAAPSNAIVESPTLDILSSSDNPPSGCDRKTHRTMIKRKTVTTHFSSRVQAVFSGSCGSQEPSTLRVSHTHAVGNNTMTIGTPITNQFRKPNSSPTACS